MAKQLKHVNRCNAENKIEAEIKDKGKTTIIIIICKRKIIPGNIFTCDGEGVVRYIVTVTVATVETVARMPLQLETLRSGE